MNDRIDVINGLQNCLDCNCDDCTQEDASGYPWDCTAYYDLICHALQLLKEQEPRVLSNNEIIKTTEVTTCYIEVKGERNLYGAYLQKYDDDHTLIATDVKEVPEMIATRHARLWSAKPTEEQREAVPWQD